MSTLQHTSELRERTTRRLVLIVMIATIALGGIVAAVVASNGGSSSAKFDGAPVVHAQPMYAGGALQRELAPLKAAQRAQAEQGQSPVGETPGHRP